MPEYPSDGGLFLLIKCMDLLHCPPITSASRAEITSYTLESQSRICDLAFANLFGWAVKYETSYAIADDTLFIRFTSPARPHPAFLIPLRRGGGCITDSLTRLRNEAEAGGYPLVIMGITPMCQERLEELCPGAFTFLENEGAADYIYLRERLVSLSGKALQSKRNHVNKFEKLYPGYSYEPITGANALECLEVERAWLEQHGSEEQGEDKEQEVILRLLSSFDELALSGGILRVDGQIVAFTIGSPINETTFGVHIEKANRDYDGAFTIINKLFASTIPESYTYVNREEDLGIEGLRKAKLSYKPDIILPKIAAVLRHECPEEL